MGVFIALLPSSALRRYWHPAAFRIGTGDWFEGQPGSLASAARHRRRLATLILCRSETPAPVRRMRLPFKVYNDHAQDTGVLTPSSTNDDSATSLAAEALFVADSPFRQSRERLSPQIVVKHRRRIPHPVTQDPPPLALHPAEDAASASETPPTETSVRVHLRAHPATTPVGTLPGQEESPAPSAS